MPNNGSKRPLADRFWEKVKKSPGCWLWTAAQGAGREGRRYGQINVNGRSVGAHVIAYELQVGPVPPGLVVDHLCNNRLCVRGSHLEAKSHRANILRGSSMSARNAKVTHCPRDHEYDEANTGITKRGTRICRTCARERMRKVPAHA